MPDRSRNQGNDDDGASKNDVWGSTSKNGTSTMGFSRAVNLAQGTDGVVGSGSERGASVTGPFRAGNRAQGSGGVRRRLPDYDTWVRVVVKASNPANLEKYAISEEQGSAKVVTSH